MGAGRSEFLECVIGLQRQRDGRVFIEGRLAASAGRRRPHRAGAGADPGGSAARRLGPDPVGCRKSHHGEPAQACLAYSISGAERGRSGPPPGSRSVIKVADPNLPVSSLSGGNQQKVVIGKALLTSPKVLLMDEPSRGIDIGAKGDVFRTMRRLAAEGMGIVFVTSDLDEVMALSDRIAVMSKGRLTALFDRADATQSAIIAASASGHGETVSDKHRETVA